MEKPRSKGSLWEMLRFLSEHSKGLKIAHLATLIGVSRVHIYKLRDRANQAGFEVEDHFTNPEVSKGWLRLKHPQSFSDIPITHEDLESLLTAVARMEPLTHTARFALNKLVQWKQSMRLSETPVVYYPLLDSYPQGLFDRVAKAIRTRRVVRVWYQNAKGQQKEYLFDPYVMVAWEPHFYLVGANHNSRSAGHDPITTLRLDQIQQLRLETQYFGKPAFDVKAYCQNQFGPFAGTGQPVRVRVHFAPEKAQFIKRTQRHPSQVVLDQDDGSVIWQIQCALSDDLVHFVSSYGPYARVLEPLALRERVLEWARGVINAHNHSPAQHALKGVE